MFYAVLRRELKDINNPKAFGNPWYHLPRFCIHRVKQTTRIKPSYASTTNSGPTTSLLGA